MKRVSDLVAQQIVQINPRFLPFADAVSESLPIGRLLRLSLFQVSVGMAAVLVIGTLNRVMIVELSVPAWLVAVMISLPLMFAPARALIGYRSDTYKSFLGMRRVPFLWFGTLLQFGGLSIMPFALIVLSGDSNAPAFVGQAAAALAFLLVGAGLHTVQTVGLALATDLSPEEKHPQVVTLLCGMLLVGMMISAVVFGIALAEFSQLRLIQVIQASAVVTMVLNSIALWKQEPRTARKTANDEPPPSFRAAWEHFLQEAQSARQLVVVGIGTIAFSMQDVLLEPYGGQILGLSVSMTTKLTAVMAVGGLIGFGVSARFLDRGLEPYRLAAIGMTAGLLAFASVIMAAPLDSLVLFAAGTALIGFGSALFLVGTLSAAMVNAKTRLTGLALGTWGAVQSFAAGAAIAVGGVLKDLVALAANHGAFGQALAVPVTGYSAVYLFEIMLLLAALVTIAPLLRPTDRDQSSSPKLA